MINVSKASSLEAEQNILGAILANNRAYDRVVEILRPEHFFDGRHQRIYAAAQKLIDQNRTADPVTLRAHFEHEGTLDDIGGQKYLVQLVGAGVSAVNVADYARLIYDRYVRRSVAEIIEAAAGELENDDLEKNADGILESVEEQLFTLKTAKTLGGGFADWGDVLDRAMKSVEAAYKADTEIIGVASGLIDLDKFTGGMRGSDLIILAARPGMGKTALAVNIAATAARDGRSVAFFSLEMGDEQLAQRVLSAHAGISADAMRKGYISADDFNALAASRQELQRLKLHIDHTGAQTVPAMRSRLRRIAREKGLDLIVVDYIGLARAVGNQRNKVHEVEEITNGLKALAKEFRVPVLALSQLSRAVESREDKRPMLADLRDSGSIEQDADQVMFLYREFYYLNQRDEPPKGTSFEDFEAKKRACEKQAQVIVAKNRHGPCGNVDLFFDPATMKFGNASRI